MDDLLIKYILEEASPEEREAVEQWLAKDNANRAHFEKLQTVWQMAAEPQFPSGTRTADALQRLKQTIQSRQTIPVKHMWTRVGTAAAVVVGIVGVVLGAYVVVIKPKPPVKKTPPVVLPDTMRTVVLPIDTVPTGVTDTVPVITPRKKKKAAPAAPALPARPKKKAVQPVPAVDTMPVKKKSRVQPPQQVNPVRKKKVAPAAKEPPIS
ncbi:MULTISPECIES: anti-sigma factor family protein [Niastella]|uniref:Anti-sigma factor n=1 Tax=Niastella soli TaxID=2821487 RepID=A0ABS3Z5J1_9BACT|nr:hypothetical protein [Niastella soli]MBO9205440.1 hypothetical protein [Niastella soli]